MLPQTVTSLFPDVKGRGAIEGRHGLGNQQEDTAHTELLNPHTKKVNGYPAQWKSSCCWEEFLPGITKDLSFIASTGKQNKNLSSPTSGSFRGHEDDTGR